MLKLSKRWLLVTLLVLLILVPVITQDAYYLGVLITMGVTITMAVTVRLVIRTGQMTMCHAAFFSMGAYGSTLLALKAGLPYWLTLPLSGVLAAVVAILIGQATLKIKGVYFAVATFAFGELVRLVYTKFSFFGGTQGLANIPRPGFFGLEFNTSRVHYYYLLLFLVLLTVAVMYRLERSRFGMNFNAIRESDALAESIGINVMRHKILAFAIACFFAALAGSFQAHYMTFINPASASFWTSTYAILYAVVGGLGGVHGPIIGAAVLTIASQYFSSFPFYEMILYGSILVLTIRFFPGGLLDLPSQVTRWLGYR